MQKKDSFISNSKFYSDKYFPHGFSRCGEFSREQAELLERHGRAYEALDKGLRDPVNDEETRFIAVCHGDAEPVSAHEDVWMRYRRKIEKRPTISPFGTIIKSGQQPTESEADEGKLSEDLEEF